MTATGAARKKRDNGRAPSDRLEDAGRGFAYRCGWGAFLAFIVVTPLFVGALPPGLGPLSLFMAYDPVSLPKAVVFLALTGLSLSALMASVLRGESRLRWHPVLWILVALVGWAGISTALSASPRLSVWGGYLRNEGLVAIFGYVLVAFLAVQYVRSVRDLRAVMVAVVVGGSLVSAYAAAQFLGIDPIQWTNVSGRVWSTFGNADMLGTYLLLPLACAVGLALTTHDRWRRLAWWAAGALAATALLMTETRGAWLGAIVLLACLVFIGWRRIFEAPRAQKTAIVAVAVVVVAAASAAIVLVRTRAAASASSTSLVLANLSNGRTIIWLTGLRGWLAHPITGWGPDAFGRAFQSAMGADWYALVKGPNVADNAHDLFVQTLVTLGLPGLVLVASALGWSLARPFRTLATMKDGDRLLVGAVWSAAAGLVVAFLFGLTTPEVTVWLWLVVGLLLALVAPKTSRSLTPRVSLAAAGRATSILGLALGVVLASWATTWLVADVMAGRAAQLPVGAAQVSEFDKAARLNPLSPNYRWLAAESLVNDAVAEQRAGQTQAEVDATMSRAIDEYYAAAAADPGDVLVRVALASVLMSFAPSHPGGDAVGRAVAVAQEAVRVAPNDVLALVTLARAYEAAGLQAQAIETARLARALAPEYSMQTLGSLGQ